MSLTTKCFGQWKLFSSYQILSQDVQHNADREGHRDIQFRGSELDSYSSSDKESSDDDAVDFKQTVRSVPQQATSDEPVTSKRLRHSNLVTK